mgnify:CR=1 FL=1
MNKNLRIRTGMVLAVLAASLFFALPLFHSEANLGQYDAILQDSAKPLQRLCFGSKRYQRLSANESIARCLSTGCIIKKSCPSE